MSPFRQLSGPSQCIHIYSRVRPIRCLRKASSNAFLLIIHSELGRECINRRISITGLAHEFPQPLSRYVAKSPQTAALTIMRILVLAMK
jgi:hypothetical protein